MIERLLINRSYARLWFGGQISQLGDMVFDTTVLLWIATVVARGRSWAPEAGSGALIASVVPVLLVSPFAGVYVDRWNPRRTMLTSDALRGLLVGTLVLLALLPRGTVPMALNAASFAGSFLFVAVVPYRRAAGTASDEAGTPPARIGMRGELAAGFQVIWRSQVLRVLVICALIVNLGSGLLTTLNVFFVESNLHTDSKYYGLLSTCTAIGDLIGALLSARVAARLGVNRAFSYPLALCGVLLLAYARQTEFTVAAVLFVLMALPISILNVAITPILIDATPRDLLGRVAGVFQPLTQASNLLGMALAGYLASTLLRGFHHRVLGIWMGTYDVVFTVAGLLFVLGGLVAWRGLRTPA